jgi:large subunit ribosomal protein L22
VGRYIRVSPYKARKVIDLIRGKEVEEAQRILAFSPNHASQVIAKVLNSAIANAENNNKLRAENLVVESCYVDEGPTLKRWMPRARGRATRIRKRTSHITIVLGVSEKRREVRKKRRIGRSRASRKG